jgi:hypothetical protein
MPHWCVSFTTWLRCRAQFITQLDDKAGGYGPDDSHQYLAMRNGLIALQNTVTTFMQSAHDQEASWLQVAHIIMGRIHRLCTSLNPAVLAEPTTLMEERVAATRATAVTPKRAAPATTSTPRSGQLGPKKPKGNPPGNRQQQSNRAASGGGGGQSGSREGCPYHNFTTGHTLFQCKVYKELSQSHPSTSAASTSQG